MIIKRIVTITLIITLTASTVILTAGLFVPVSILGSVMGQESIGSEVAVVAVDKNGRQIADARVVQNDDGTTTIVSADGEVIEDAGTATVSKDDAADNKKSDATTPSVGGSSAKPTPNSPSVPSPTPSPTPNPTPTPPPAPAPKPTPPPAPTPPPPPPAPACGSGGSCTAAQVASHNNQGNCWVIYSGKVYNVTGFVSKHSGGRTVFNSNTCGRDIGQYLKGTMEPASGQRYNHSNGDISQINSYFVGNLA